MNERKRRKRDFLETTTWNTVTKKQLYKMLYLYMQPMLLSEGLDQAIVDRVFQSSFLVLQKKIEWGKLAMPNLASTAERTKLQQTFHRILHHQLYQPAVYPDQTIRAVRNANVVAERNLIAYLQSASMEQYAWKLIHDFKLASLSAQDILQEGVVKMIVLIKAEQFELEKTATRELNKNRLLKFYKLLIYRWANDERKKRKPKLESKAQEKLPEPPAEVQEMEDTDLPLLAKMQQLFYQLDAAGQYILKASYFQQWSLKEIGKASPFAAYQTTAAVKEKKQASLKKLRSYLAVAMQKMNTVELDQLTKLTQYILTEFQEPCRTILTNALPPKEKSYKEIVEILQQTRPTEEVEHLKNEGQIKKRKYKCMQTLYDQIWSKMLNPSN